MENNKKERVRKKAAEPIDEAAILPKPSIWPVALAFSLIVLFLGIMFHPVVVGLGILMIIGSAVGWIMQRT